MLAKFFKQLVVTICLVSILFSSPALALASQNTEAHIPKGDLDIANKIHNGGHTSTIIGIHNIIEDTNLFRIQDFQCGLITEPIPVTIDEIVRQIVSRVMAVSIGIPIAGVADAVLVGQEINHALTCHKEENNVSMKSLSSEKH